jgi:lipoprotein NlpI
MRKEFLPPNHPDIEKLYNNMGLIHTNKSEFDEALQIIQNTLSLDHI